MFCLKKMVPDLMCCFGWNDTEPNPPATLHSLPLRDSPASAAFSPRSIPSIMTTTDDLQRIFASPSTPGGYNAAKSAQSKRLLPQGSLDLNFQFGSLNQPKRRQGSFDQLSGHLRGRLSRNRLSKRSSKDGSIDQIHVPQSGPANDSVQHLGVSQRSTGMLDLLTSRAASEGGYDSDAKSIRTPVLGSNAGTLRIGPAFVTKQPTPKVLENAFAAAPPVTPKSQTDVMRDVSKSSPFPASPLKQSFSSAMQIAPDETPAEALRRLSVGIGNGTIKAPGTPELEALRTPSLHQVERVWHLPVTAPNRVSNIGTGDLVARTDMKRLSDEVDLSKRQNEDLEKSEYQQSLLSDLDPGLLKYLERYAMMQQSTLENVNSSPLTAIRMIHTGTSSLQEKKSTGALASNSGGEQSQAPAVLAGEQLTDSSQSLHLYNMRISQRLASSSRNDTSSTSNMDQSSSQSTASLPVSPDQCQSLSNNRYSSFVAHEPNRRPSDPRTMDLFETGLRRTKPRLSGNPVTCSGEGTGLRGPGHHSSLVDDSSSVYSARSGMLDGTSPMPPLPRKTAPLKNQNSIAIGGRSASLTVPGRREIALQRRSTANEANSAVEGTKSVGVVNDDASVATPNFGQRSVSLPWHQRLNELHETPTPRGRRCQIPTEENEAMSFEAIPSAPDSQVQTSNTSVDGCNENLSEISYHGSNAPARNQEPEDVTTTASREDHVLPSDNDDLNAISTQSVVDIDRSVTTRTDTSQKNRCEKVYRRNSNLLQVPQTPCGTNTRAAKYHDPRGDHNTPCRNVSDEGDPVRQISATHLRKRSLSTSDIGSLLDHKPDAMKRKGSMPLIFSKLTSFQITPRASSTSKGMKKVSLQNLARKLTMMTPINNDARAESIQLKKSFGIWASFPLSGRVERNESADLRDGVDVRDFQGNHSVPHRRHLQEPVTRQDSVPLGARQKLSVPKLRFSRTKTQSMTFVAPAEDTIAPQRQSLAERLRRLYRSSSSDLKNYTSLHGHRSSLSFADEAKYPELECFPGEGFFHRTLSGHNAVGADTNGTGGSSYGTLSEAVSASGMGSDLAPGATGVDWVGHYADCVGSLSALRSETSIDGPERSQDFSLGRKSHVAKGTVQSKVGAQRKVAEAADKLLKPQVVEHQPLRRGNRSRERSFELSMPGSFD